MIKQTLNDRGELHSFNDKPAYVEYDDETGALIAEKWYQDGELHRDDDQPAVLIYDRKNSEIIRTEAYYYFDLLHREGDKPAEILRDSEGNIEQVQYYNMGLLHRAVGPASIRYCPDDGRIWGSEFWIEDECLKRLVEAYPHGSLIKEDSGSPRGEVSLGEVSAELTAKARAFAEFRSNVVGKLEALSEDKRMAIRIALGTAFRGFFKKRGLSEEGIRTYFVDATGDAESINHNECIQRYALGTPDGANNLLVRMIFLYLHDGDTEINLDSSISDIRVSKKTSPYTHLFSEVGSIIENLDKSKSPDTHHDQEVKLGDAKRRHSLPLLLKLGLPVIALASVVTAFFVSDPDDMEGCAVAQPFQLSVVYEKSNGDLSGRTVQDLSDLLERDRIAFRVQVDEDAPDASDFSTILFQRNRSEKLNVIMETPSVSGEAHSARFAFSEVAHFSDNVYVLAYDSRDCKTPALDNLDISTAQIAQFDNWINPDDFEEGPLFVFNLN